MLGGERPSSGADYHDDKDGEGAQECGDKVLEERVRARNIWGLGRQAGMHPNERRLLCGRGSEAGEEGGRVPLAKAKICVT